ncbi:hypothetical protein [Ferrimonas sp. SCSIO 43195]|uniref:hypothetical protein n=1 Tax=Ferrimonas sp. SCSIO 43195 TaxID=2822844 RepID=UPI002075C27E|nr:hypothetical protein [Ferrimonas sp. SCSIO 43195]USD35955.1 hypothetical protein J8Z22_12980 [Ferrimonas sp. SCSIO 43195]
MMKTLSRLTLACALVSLCGPAAAGKTVISLGYLLHESQSLDDNLNQFDRTTLSLANINAGDWGRIVTVGIVDNLEKSASYNGPANGGEDWSTYKLAFTGDFKTGIKGLNTMFKNVSYYNVNGYENNLALGLSYDIKALDASWYFSGGYMYSTGSNAWGTDFQGDWGGYHLEFKMDKPITDNTSIGVRYIGMHDRTQQHADIMYGGISETDGNKNGYCADINLSYRFSNKIQTNLALRQLHAWYGYKNTANILYMGAQYAF